MTLALESRALTTVLELHDGLKDIQVFQAVVTGTPEQVEKAKGLITALLQQPPQARQHDVSMGVKEGAMEQMGVMEQVGEAVEKMVAPIARGQRGLARLS